MPAVHYRALLVVTTTAKKPLYDSLDAVAWKSFLFLQKDGTGSHDLRKSQEIKLNSGY